MRNIHYIFNQNHTNTQWVQLYAEYKGLGYDSGNSNSKRWFSIPDIKMNTNNKEGKIKQLNDSLKKDEKKLLILLIVFLKIRMNRKYVLIDYDIAKLKNHINIVNMTKQTHSCKEI